MKCPFSHSYTPPCKIESHPYKKDVEYCKVCGEWRHPSDVGSDFPNVFWTLLAIAIVMTIFMGMVRNSEQPQVPNQEINSTLSQ